MRFARFPLLTLSIPLLIVGFRIGAVGAAATCEATGFLVVLLWMLKVRAGGPAVALAASGAWAGIPFVILAAIMILPIIMGFAADDRDRAMRALRFNEQRFPAVVAALTDGHRHARPGWPDHDGERCLPQDIRLHLG